MSMIEWVPGYSLMRRAHDATILGLAIIRKRKERRLKEQLDKAVEFSKKRNQLLSDDTHCTYVNLMQSDIDIPLKGKDANLYMRKLFKERQYSQFIRLFVPNCIVDPWIQLWDVFGELPDMYWMCLLARFVLSFTCVTTGYIHPDEFFQSVEVASGDAYKVETTRTWEFECKRPIRSVVPMYVLYTIPLKILRFIDSNSNWMMSPFLPSILSTCRLVLFFFSICCVDIVIYKICKRFQHDVERTMYILASSHIMLLFATRTFSNTIELFFFSVLFYFTSLSIESTCESSHLNRLISDAYHHSQSAVERAKILKARKKLQNSLSNTQKWKFINFEDMIHPDFRYGISLGTILGLGVFNRPTFLVFCVVPLTFWLHRPTLSTVSSSFLSWNRKKSQMTEKDVAKSQQDQGGKKQRLGVDAKKVGNISSQNNKWDMICAYMIFNLRLTLILTVFLLTSCICIVLDSLYFSGCNGSDLSWTHFWNLDLHKIFNSLKVTPFNFIAYNVFPNSMWSNGSIKEEEVHTGQRTQKGPVSDHGHHPVYQHILINLPLLFGPIGLMSLYTSIHFIYTCLTSFHTTAIRHSIYALTCTTFLFSLLFFSFVGPSHHEPRFILPLLIPSVLLSGYKMFRYEVIVKLWIFFNVSVVFFYGFLHQAGLYPILRHVGNHSSKNVSDIVFCHTYMPPKFPMISYETIKSSSLSVIHDLGSSARLPAISSKLVTLAKKRRKRKQVVLFVAPDIAAFSVQDYLHGVKDGFNLRRMANVFPHWSSEFHATLSVNALFDESSNNSSFSLSSSVQFFYSLFSISVFEVEVY